MQESKKISILELTIVLMPILNLYTFFINGLGLGDVLMAFELLYLLLKKKHIWIHPKHYPYIAFTMYAVLISLISVLIHLNFSFRDIAVRNTIAVFYMAMICLIRWEDFDIQKLTRYYRNAALVVCFFTFFQIAAYYLSHRIILGVLPGFRLNYALTNYHDNLARYQAMYRNFYRPTGLFLEPAQMAQYLGPALIIILFSKENSHRLRDSLIISITMLLSTSTVAFVSLAFIWLVYIFTNVKLHFTPKKLFITFVFIIGILYALRIPRIQSVIRYSTERLTDILNGSTVMSSGSAFDRIFKGFMIWNVLKPLEKVLGIGFGTYDSYNRYYPINIANGAEEYMSSLTYILVSGGLIGLFMFLFAILSYVRGKGKMNVILALYMLLTFLSSSLFNQPVYLLNMLLMIHVSGDTVFQEQGSHALMEDVA